MALPQLNTPTYELLLPSTDLKVQYRPFLVKEEKLLLLALESENDKEIIQAVKQVIENCTFGKLNAEELPIFDIEYIFLQIRAKSVGEVVKFKILCPDDKKTYADVELDLTAVDVQVEDEHNNNVVLDENKKLGIVFKYPTIQLFRRNLTNTNENIDTLLEIIYSCVDYIYEGENIYYGKDSTTQELKDFVENLSQKQFQSVQKFFESMPKLKHDINILNPKTNVESKIQLVGLQDFFEYASLITH